MAITYRYQLRCLEAERFQVELSDGQGVGPSPHLWFDKGQLTLSEQAPKLGLGRFFNPPPSPRYTRIVIELGAWLEVLQPQDLLEIGRSQGHHWVQLHRRGRLEMRSGNLTLAEFPAATLVNTFEENGALEVRSGRHRSHLRPGHTSVLEGYHIYLARLEGFKQGHLAEGWLARDSWAPDWMMSTFASVGERSTETA